MDVDLFILSSTLGIILRFFLSHFQGLDKISPILLGVWEGVVLYQQICTSSNTTEFILYLPTAMSIGSDFIMVGSSSRAMLIFMWTVLSAAASSALGSSHWYDTISERKAQRRGPSRGGEGRRHRNTAKLEQPVVGRTTDSRNSRPSSPLKSSSSFVIMTRRLPAQIDPAHDLESPSPIRSMLGWPLWSGDDDPHSLRPDGDGLSLGANAPEVPRSAADHVPQRSSDIDDMYAEDHDSGLGDNSLEEQADEEVQDWIEISQMDLHPEYYRYNAAGDLSTIAEESAEHEDRSMASLALEVERPGGPVPLSSYSESSLTVCIDFDEHDPLATPPGYVLGMTLDDEEVDLLRTPRGQEDLELLGIDGDRVRALR